MGIHRGFVAALARAEPGPASCSFPPACLTADPSGIMDVHASASSGGALKHDPLRKPPANTRLAAAIAWFSMALLWLPMPASSARTSGVAPAQSEIHGPRELLEMLGVGKSQWAVWQDDHAISPAEIEQLLGIVFRFSRFHPAEWEQWAQAGPTLAHAVAQPDDARGRIVVAQGNVLEVVRWKLDSDLLERFEVPPLFVVRVRVDAESGPVVVQFATPRIPQAWTRHASLVRGQTVQAVGIVLKRVRPAADPGPPTLLMAGPRLRWYPAEPNEELGVHADQLPLVVAGLPFELLDDARATNGQPLGQSDRECFVQMLRACRSIDPPPAPANQSLLELLKQPLRWIGRPVQLHGRTRRVARIFITDERDRARLGFDSYYQIDLFVDLAGAKIEIQPPPGADQPNAPPAVISNVYPVTVCTIDLPPELRTELGDQPSANIRRSVNVDAYFLKMWSYYSPLVARFGQESRQTVPLVIATRIRPRRINPAPDTIGIWLPIGVVVLILATWLWTWRSNRAERALRERIRERRERS